MKSDLDIAIRSQNFRARITDTPRFHWGVAVFLLLIQQSAFVAIPLIMADTSLRGVENPYNTAGVAMSAALLIICCVPLSKQIYVLISFNRSAIFYTLIVLSSTIWSIHPDLSIRRGIGYIITIFVAFYVSIRFSPEERMRVLSWSFAVSAFGSLLFVAVFPQYGIMHGIDDTGDLEGNWRGVFTHKNPFGFVMAAAVFTELYLIALQNGRLGWRYLNISVFFVLVILSRSTTALLTSTFYILCTCIYLIWKRNRIIATCIFILFVSVLCMVLMFFFVDPQFMFSMLGKDPSLTGRTDLWPLVIELIEQKPWLGWGYRAMWLPDDVITQRVDDLTGNWGVPSAHNVFLEVALELGLVGLFALLIIIVIAFWRGLRCCRIGVLPLGWYSLVFFIGSTLEGLTIETLGQNQQIEWVVFNILSFTCGQSLMSKRRNLTS